MIEEERDGVFCPDCRKGVGEGARFCRGRGQRLEKGLTPEEREDYIREYNASHEATLENTSGQGHSSIVPEGGKGWNWGAFGLTWIWGICNKVWLALLVFIPIYL